jgi:hypothetical protein
MYSWRVTKYNPSYRDAWGAYLEPDWTAVSDIGRDFGGKVLTAEEYLRIESAYVSAALSFMREANVETLRCCDLEQRRAFAYAGIPGVEIEDTLQEGAVFDASSVGWICQAALREATWCRLVGEDSFIHFGYDFYMFVGCPKDCPRSVQLARDLGLFAEEMESPYLDLEG